MVGNGGNNLNIHMLFGVVVWKYALNVKTIVLFMMDTTKEKFV